MVYLLKIISTRWLIYRIQIDDKSQQYDWQFLYISYKIFRNNNDIFAFAEAIINETI